MVCAVPYRDAATERSQKRKREEGALAEQAQNNAIRLASFFRADSIHQWVTPAVVWANPASALTVENPLVAVWTLDRLPEELGNLWREQVIDEEKHKRIVEKLTALCQPQKENG